MWPRYIGQISTERLALTNVFVPVLGDVIMAAIYALKNLTFEVYAGLVMPRSAEWC